MREAPVWIAINGTRRIMLTCAPHERESLALGHLLSEGWIENPDGVLALTAADGPGGSAGIEVTIDADRADATLALRRHRVEHGCGLRHLLDCEGRRAAGPAPDVDIDGASLFRTLFHTADDASPDGGVHAAAIANVRTLMYADVDVARHCAVDRAIGLGVAHGARLDGLGLITTSRVSGSIALKAVNARLSWIASRSVATPLAHEIAAAGGIRIIERAARRRDDS